MVNFILYGVSQVGLLLSSQWERQPSHLEVTERDLYRRALDILAVVFYTFLPEEVGKMGRSHGEVEGGPFGCGTTKTRENSISFRECFMGKRGANVIGQPIRRLGLHSYRISLVSIKGEGRWGGSAHTNVHEHV